MTPNIPIFAWDPDGDPTRPGVLSDVDGLVPTRRGYAPEYSLEDAERYTDPVPDTPFGSDTVQLSNGNVWPLIGTDTGLYLALTATGTIEDRSRTTAYTTATIQTAAWRFAAFDTDTYAINYDNTLQRTTAIGSTDFSDVSGGPKAYTMAVQNSFMIVANIKDGSYAGGDSWLCCASDDPTDWTVDIATGCATGNLTNTPGPIERLIPYRDYVIAFKKDSFYRGQFVGFENNSWEWPVISTSIGIIGHDAVCESDDNVLYWLSENGFYRWAGGAVERIKSAPWEWLLDNSSGYAFLQTTQAMFDPVRRVVRFIMQLPAFADTVVLSYHPDTDRWGKSELAVSRGIHLPSEAVPTVGESSPLLRALPLGYISSSDLNLKIQTGTPGTTSFTTGDIGDDDEAFALTKTRVRFLIEPTTSVATHFHRMNLGETLTEEAITAERDDGKYDLTHSARWHRIQFEQTGRYEVSGFRVETPKAGRR